MSMAETDPGGDRRLVRHRFVRCDALAMLGGGDCHKGRLVQDGLDAVELELGTLELKALDLDTSGVEVPILVLHAAAKNNPDLTGTPA